MKQKMKGCTIVLLLLCFVAFMLYGIHFNCFGTSTETMMGYFQIDESRQGMIMTVQSIGGIVMTVVLGLYGERLNKIHGIAMGLGVMGVASVLIGFIPVFFPAGSGYMLMLVFSLLAGLGSLTVDLLMNGVIADVYPDRKSVFLPYVHAFYGVGAMLAPLYVSALTSPDAPQTFAQPYLILGIVSVVLCGGLFLNALRVNPHTPYRDMSVLRKQARGNPAEVFKDVRAWLFLGAGFLYLCFQTGMTAWLPQYAMNRLNFTYDSSATLVTFYFLGALVMRLVSPVIYKKLSVRNFYVLTIALSAVLFALFLFLPCSQTVARIIILFLGILQGASVPSMVILCSDAFPGRSASASSVIVLSVSLAALIAPSVMGSVIQGGHYLGAMLLILACLPLSIPPLLLATRSK